MALFQCKQLGCREIGVCAVLSMAAAADLLLSCSADIPMLVAGDFNSIPGSAAHSLLVKGRVEPSQLVSTALRAAVAARLPHASCAVPLGRTVCSSEVQAGCLDGCIVC
jgi:endonuclease/exonuclease/phosphatase family metal-dependent hydrolase